MSINLVARAGARRALWLAIAAVTGTASTSVFAQNDDVITVTGTRVRSPGATSNSPIQTVTSSDLELTQPVAVEEFFKKIPGAIPAIGPGTNNGTNGGASIDLRGLGSNRNVVLVDGPDAGKKLLAESETLTVGTADGNDLVLEDPTVSRYHLELTRGG